MRFLIPLALLAFGALDITLLVKLGQSVGFWRLFALIFGTAVLGAVVAYRQGFAVMRRMAEEIQAGEARLISVVEGALLLFAGSLLVAPGPACDMLGLLLLIPPLRRLVARFAVSRLAKAGTVEVHVDRRATRSRPGPREPFNDNGPIIEGEFERIDDPPPRVPPRHR